jgi:hypothetical protein
MPLERYPPVSVIVPLLLAFPKEQTCLPLTLGSGLSDIVVRVCCSRFDAQSSVVVFSVEQSVGEIGGAGTGKGTGKDDCAITFAGEMGKKAKHVIKIRRRWLPPCTRSRRDGCFPELQARGKRMSLDYAYDYFE